MGRQERHRYQSSYCVLVVPSLRHTAGDSGRQWETAGDSGRQRETAGEGTVMRRLDVIAASMYDKDLVGPSIRPICARCCFTMTRIIQACSDFH